MSSTGARSATLALYRGCLRSVQQMPDAGHRMEYKKYVRGGFRDKARLPPGSSQSEAALEGAREQLERMNYYHSVREAKRKQQPPSKGGEETTTPSIPDSSPTTINTVLHQWLEKALPELSEKDRNHYTARLAEDGFDTLELLSKDLRLMEDLGFMKKAHQRAIGRTYFQDKS